MSEFLRPKHLKGRDSPPQTEAPKEASDQLTQQQADELVESWAEQIQNGTEDAFGVFRRLPERVDIRNNEPSIYTLMYRSIFNVARIRPELTQQLGEIENTIGQNPQMMHPRHLLDIASDVIWDPRIHNYLKNSLVHGLGYALRFMQSREYEKAITEKLNFIDAKHFSDTAHFLEFMQELYNIGDEYSYGGDNVVTSRVHEGLQQAAEKKQGSYLLNVRAQELLADMDGRSWVSSGFDRTPFFITKDRYGRHKKDGLYVSMPEEQEHIARLIDEFNEIEAQLQPPQHLVDEAIARGETEVWWMPDQELMRQRSALYQEIDASFTHRLTYDELSQTDSVFSAEERAVEEHDFAYLQRKPIRDVIKNDFEIEINNLTLSDQYKLLRVLKTVEYGKATPLLLEATRTLWKSGVKDYLSEIKGGQLEDVTGGQLSHEDSEAIRHIHGEQYRDKYPKSKMEKLRGELEQSLESAGSRFYLYRKNGEIITYVRFDNLVASNDSQKHMASFMTNPQFEGGALGQALLEVALRKELTDGPIYAECDPERVSFYERFGFYVIRGPYKDDDGVDTCDIALESQHGSKQEAA